MGSVPDLKGKMPTTMEASTSKDRKTFARSLREKSTGAETNNDCKFDMVTSLNKKDVEVRHNQDTEVDIINCTTDDQCDSVQSQSEDATVSSSSFGDSFSDVGSHESDDEVVSQLSGDPASLRGFGGSGDLFPVRKKRLTAQWRKYIHPLMWRCKWVELQVKKFQSQAMKYDKEVEKDDQAKKFKYRNFELEGLCAKAMPFTHDSPREKLMRRKVRKLNEESDAEVYLSQHNLFSFFATKSPNEGVKMDDDQTNSATSTEKNVRNEFKAPDELQSLDFRDDNLLEQILWKVEVAQSRAVTMKAKLKTLMTENATRISSTEDLTLLESKNALASMESTPPPIRDGPSAVASFASQLMQLNMGDDLVKVNPEKADPSHGEGTCLQTNVNEPTEQEPPPAATKKRNPDEILIYNRRAKKLQAVKAQPIGEPKEDKGHNAVSVSEDSSQNAQTAQVNGLNQTTAQYKKKRAARARRKSGPSLWSQRTLG